MTFAADSAAGQSWLGARWRRAVLFWLLMLVLALVLWRVAPKPPEKGRELSDSEFLNEVEKQNVQGVVLYPQPNTAALTGTLRLAGARFSLPREAIPGLTGQPLVLLVLFWIFWIRQTRQQRGQP